MNFLRGMITGCILGTALGMSLAPQQRKNRKGIMGFIKGNDDVQSNRVFRSMGRTVNEAGREFGKTVNDFIRK